MKKYENEISQTELRLLAGAKGRVLRSVLCTTDDCTVSIEDVVIRFDEREMRLHISENNPSDGFLADTTRVEVGDAPIGTFRRHGNADAQSEASGNAGWHANMIGKEVKRVSVYRNEIHDSDADGNAFVLNDTGAIAFCFDDSCVVFRKAEFSDIWNVDYQDDPNPDLEGVMENPVSLDL